MMLIKPERMLAMTMPNDRLSYVEGDTGKTYRLARSEVPEPVVNQLGRMIIAAGATGKPVGDAEERWSMAISERGSHFIATFFLRRDDGSPAPISTLYACYGDRDGKEWRGMAKLAIKAYAGVVVSENVDEPRPAPWCLAVRHPIGRRRSGNGGRGSSEIQFSPYVGVDRTSQRDGSI